MKLPTATDYCDAIQYPQDCFADPELRAAEAVTDPLGLPRTSSGNFATVFHVAVPNGRQYAVRCFVRSYANDQQQRYDAIAEFLAAIDSSWKVGFEFLAKGIRIRGDWFPILKMEWIEAESFRKYLESHLHDARALVALAERFAAAVADLQKHGAAHGDLQHGNVLVCNDGLLKLIDYDGMFVPALAGREATEVGHRNYQHPSRSIADFGPGLDNFSAWVIYASLLSLAVDPGLWARLNGGDEKLLFSRADFTEPSLGLGFRALELNGESELAELAGIIKTNLSRPPLSVAELRQMHVTLGSAMSVEAEPPPPQRAVGAPEWIRAIASDGAHAQTGAAWLVSHLPVPELIAFSGSVRAARRAAISLLFSGLLLFMLVMTTTVPFFIAGAVEIALVAAGAGVARLAFVRSPEFNDKRWREQRAREATNVRKECEEEKGRLGRSLTAINDRERTLIERTQRASIERQQAMTRDVQRQQAVTQRQLADVTNRRRDLLSSRQRQEAQALRALQEAACRRELGRFYIGSASIRGIGEALTAALAAKGVRTAGDFSGIRTFVPSGGHGGRSGNLAAAIVLPSGSAIQVRGIGPAKAEALDRWRISMRSRVQSRIPNALPAAERQQLSAWFDSSLRALDAEERRTHTDGQARVAEITARHQTEAARETGEAKQAQAELVVERQAVTADLQRADKATRDAKLAAQQAERAILPYRDITFGNFIRAANRGIRM